MFFEKLCCKCTFKCYFVCCNQNNYTYSRYLKIIKRFVAVRLIKYFLKIQKLKTL